MSGLLLSGKPAFMKFRHAAALALVAWYVLTPALSWAEGHTVASKTFTAPDGAFSFRYWDQLVRCKPPNRGDVWEPADICSAYHPVCDGSLVYEQYGVACFAYPRNKFTNTPAFEAATFSVEILDTKKTDKSCLTFDPDFEERTGTKKINGVLFTVFGFVEGGMNQSVDGTAYRAFYKGKCYQLGVNFATFNDDPEDYDPPIRSLTERDVNEVNSKLEQALKSFKFLK